MTQESDSIRSFETSYSRVPGPKHRGRPVVTLLYQDLELMDLAGPCEVFHLANLAANARQPEAGYQYDVRLLSLTGEKRITTTAGVELTAHEVADGYAGAIDTLLVPGGAISDVLADRHAIAAVEKLASRAERIASVCSGAFILAAAGLLEGRRATTHWRGGALLADRFPNTRVEIDSIFVEDGSVYTSAGSTAGIDLALHLVEADLGRGVAMHVARDMVVFLKRPGGQAQFSTTLDVQSLQAGDLRELVAWIPDHLGEDLRIERLASVAHMSPRNFVRRFRREVGATPARYVERVRVEAAQRELQESCRSLDEIAAVCGFGSRDSMRRVFLRVLGVAPSVYRQRFGEVAPLKSGS